LQAPLSTEPGKGATPRAKKQDAHYGVTDHVPALAEQVVPEAQSRDFDPEKKMKNPIQKPGGMSA